MYSNNPVDLPNTTCEITKELEQEFVSKLNEYSIYDINVRTVLKSRTLNKHFNVFKSKSVSLKKIYKYFQTNGHTLSIDYTKSYVRNCSFDLDCLCRIKHHKLNQNDTANDENVCTISEQQSQFVQQCVQQGQTEDIETHLSLNLVNEFCAQLKYFLSLFVADVNIIQISIWNLACGYHVYTNIPVSLVLHEMLFKLLTEHFHHNRIKIEVPSQMPLPYSAKNTSRPYSLVTDVNKTSYNSMNVDSDCNDNEHEPELYLIPSSSDLFFYEIIKCDNSKRNPNLIEFCTLYYKSSISTKLYIPTDLKQVFRTRKVHNFKNIESITFSNDTYKLCLPQFETFINTISKQIFFDEINPEFNGYTLFDEDDEFEHEPTKHVTYISDDDEDEDQDIEKKKDLIFNHLTFSRVLFDSEIFKAFINNFCHYFDLSSHCSNAVDIFVDASARDEDGAMHLQHFIVALHKSFASVDSHIERHFTIEKFKQFLLKLYSEKIQHNVTIKICIESYCAQTYKAYTNISTSSILEYLGLLYCSGATALMSTDEIINKLLEYKLQSTAENYLKNQEEKDVTAFINEYITILQKIKFLIFKYEESDKTPWYSLNYEYYYSHKSVLAVESLPQVSLWINIKKGFNEQFNTALNNRSREFCEVISFTKCEFMFSTLVGVFNSISGLYVSTSPFIRHTTHRQVAIWPPEENIRKMSNQNNLIVEKCKIVSDVYEKMITEFETFFVHYQLAPAILQLRFIANICDYNIAKFDKKLLTFGDNLDSAEFLLDYYTIDPKFVYAIMILYEVFGSEIFDYDTLLDKVFRTYYDKSECSWQVFFEPYINDLSFDEEKYKNKSQYSFLEVLMSIRSSFITVTRSKSYYIRMFLIALLFCKCISFRPFVNAFNIDLTLPVRRTEPIYGKFYDCKFETTTEIALENMNRAIEIVFGRNLTVFQKDLINFIIMVCTSTCFLKEDFLEFMAVMSTLYITENVLKKLFLLYGASNSGKTMFANIFASIYHHKIITSYMEACDERANVTARVDFTVVNEITRLKSMELKTITGGDTESMKRFHTQEYVLSNKRSLLFGATNNYIFITGIADRVTVDRLHIICMNGKQVDSKKPYNFFKMFVDDNFYSSNAKVLNSASIVNWLSYYVLSTRHDDNHYPRINVDNNSVCNYQNQVMLKNNRVYRTIVYSGIVANPDFYIEKSIFLEYIEKSINLYNLFKSTSDFMSEFVQTYPHCLQSNNTDIIGFQLTQFIKHVNEVMLAHYDASDDTNFISMEELNEFASKKYNSHIEINNAINFFVKKYEQYYDYKKLRFNNLQFVNNNNNLNCSNDDDTSSIVSGGGSGMLSMPNSLILQANNNNNNSVSSTRTPPNLFSNNNSMNSNDVNQFNNIQNGTKTDFSTTNFSTTNFSTTNFSNSNFFNNLPNTNVTQ